MRRWLLPLLLLPLLLFPAAVGADPPPLAPDVERAQRLLVLKGARRLQALRGDAVLLDVPIGLGFEPVGHKQREGDGRTPEGSYRISGRNPRSGYHLSLRISYPAAADRAAAEARGESPGGNIMIHGQPNGWPGPTLPGDWTLGCVAVSDDAMDALWRITPVGTPIELRP